MLQALNAVEFPRPRAGTVEAAGELFIEDLVDQGGFACVGASHYGYLDGKGRFLSVFRFFLQFFFKRSPFLLEKTVQPGG